MAPIRVPARDLIIEVEDSTPNVWLELEGVKSGTVDKSANETLTETTDFHSGGHYSARKMQRGATLSLEADMLQDGETGARPPGQARVEEIAEQFGEASIGRVRFRHPLDTTWRVWRALLSVGGAGGGNNDMTSWPVTITRDEAASSMAVV